jgi:hypothetical protein
MKTVGKKTAAKAPRARSTVFAAPITPAPVEAANGAAAKAEAPLTRRQIRIAAKKSAKAAASWRDFLVIQP